MKNVLKAKRLVAWMLVFVLAVTTVFNNGIVAQAASSTAVKSVTVKIGSKKVTKKTYTLTKGKTATLKVSVSPSKAKKSVTYKSNKTSVATVSKKGKVTAKKAGTAKITVTVTGKNNKKKSTWVKIKVKDSSSTTTVTPTPQQPTVVAPESVTAILQKSPILVGEATVVSATVLPANATDKKVTYSSSNIAVATVNEAGVVTGIGKGQAVITVTTSNGKTATVTVVVNDIEVTAIKLDQSEVNLSISQTTTLTPTIEPSNATTKTLTWETSDPAVATVDGGLVTAKGVGTATITAKSANGVKAECKVTVSEETTLENGITVKMTNPYVDANGKKYENTALVGDDMTIQARVVKDNQPLGNTDVTLTLEKGYGNCSPAFEVKGLGTTKTDENGYATFSIGLKSDFNYDAVSNRYQSYIVKAREAESSNSAEITVSFASVKLSGIKVENGNGIYPAIVPSDNAASGDSGIFSTYYSDETKKEQYVSSQQVSSSDDDHKVYFSATPYLVLPATKVTEHTDNWTYTVTNGTSGPCSVYNDATNTQTTVQVASVPAGLQSITLDFDKLELSKYTSLNVDVYDKKTGSSLYHEEFAEDKNDSQSIQIQQQTGADSYLVVSLISQGQVDTTSAGYVLTKVYGPWKSADTMDPEQEEIAGAVTWADVSASVRYENQTWSYSEAQRYFPEDSKYLNESYKYSYRIPVYPYTGNALITVKDSNDNAIGNFLYPTVNNGSNVNVLAAPSDTISAIFVSANEIDDKVGTVSQNGNLAVVDSQKVGITALKASVTVAGLDTQELNDLNGGVLYTSVQWAPVPIVEEEPEYPDYFAIEGQTVEVTAQLYDKNGNPKTDENRTIEFSDADGKIDLTGTKAGAYASLVGVTNAGSTDNKGSVTITFRDVTSDTWYSCIEALTAKAEGYNVKLTFDGGKTYVETGDIYWVDLGLSFVNTAVKGTDRIRTTQFENSKKEIDATASYNVSETVGWNIGYQIVARSLMFRYKNRSNTGTDYVDAASTKISEFISVSGVSLKYGVDSDKVNLTEQNGTATLKSTTAGTAQLTGKLVVADPTKVTFKFYDKDGKIVEYTNVGKNDPAINSTVLALNTEWKASGTQVELIVPSKVNVNADATVYVKVIDNLGNPLKDQKVEYAVTGLNATTGYVATADTDAKGITAITLLAPNSTSGSNSSVVKVKVNDSIEKSETLYYSADPHEVFTIFTDTENRYAVKVGSDLKTIDVYFSRDVDETSIKAGQFTFAQEGSTDTYTVETAEISSTATNCVRITLDKPIANKGASHILTVKAYVDSSGIQYLLRDTDGQIVVTPGTYKFVPSERQ